MRQRNYTGSQRDMERKESSGTLLRKKRKISSEEFLWKATKTGGRSLFSSAEHCRRPVLVQDEQKDGHNGDPTLSSKRAR